MRIPERYIKARKTAQAKTEHHAELLKKQNADNEKLKDHAVKVAKQYADEYAKHEQEKKAIAEKALKENKLVIPAEPKLLLVLRLRGLKGLSPKARMILDLFRLRQVNNAVFIRCNKATLNALKMVEPYVTYGEPNLETIRRLCYVRGYGKVNKSRIPITDNTVIDGVLGKDNIKCMEDLVHEIYTVGPNFKQANNFLWPFKLNPTELVAKRKQFVEGGDHGNRGRYINDLIQKMI